MPTVTFPISANADDGETSGRNSVYATARSTGTAISIGATQMGIGQSFDSPDFICLQTFLAFDTSTLPDHAVVSAVTLRVNLVINVTGIDFIAEARLHAWDGTLAGTYVPGGDLASKLLLATFNTSTFGPTGSYYTFVSTADFKNNINTVGKTRFVITSSRQRLANAPSGAEFFRVRSLDEGTGNPPLLDVTYTTKDDFWGWSDGFTGERDGWAIIP